MRIAVFTKNRTNPAYAAARLGARRAASALGAQTVDFVPDTPDDVGQQIRLIDEALAQRPDAFVIAPVHPTRVDEALRRIDAAGIPICAFVNPVKAVRTITFAGSDDFALGCAVARHLYGHLGGKGTVLLLSGPQESPTSAPRMRGFYDAAREFPAMRLAGPLLAGFHREPAREQVACWKEPFDAILAANDVMALGALDALQAAGRSVVACGVNAIPEAIEAIKDGTMLATADFDAMNLAALATECAIRHLRGERVPAKIELPVQLVERGNCARWDLPFEQRRIRTLHEVKP